MESEARPLLALFAHPDDEFAVFPWIRAAVEQGRTVHCLWLTDGGFNGQDIERRNEESAKILSGLGVHRAHMHFVGAEWKIPDGELHHALHDVVAKLLERFAGLAGGAELLIPAWEGGHQDHDATHLAGLSLAAAAKARARQYSLYHGKGLKGPWFRVLSPLAENGPIEFMPTTLAQRMGHAIRCLGYPSQWKSFAGLLPFYILRMLRRDAFALQSVAPARVGERPHAGALLYERRGGPAWPEFAGRTQALRQRLVGNRGNAD
jgi:LmbE family N-acetylglucosaminyl deacetylase